MYCTKCGAKLNEDARFCASCGTPVSAPKTMNEPGFRDPAIVLKENGTTSGSGGMVAGGIVCLLLGVVGLIYGFMQNNSLEAQAKSIWSSGSSNPGTIFIILGGALAALGLILVIAGAVRPSSTPQYSVTGIRMNPELEKAYGISKESNVENKKTDVKEKKDAEKARTKEKAVFSKSFEDDWRENEETGLLGMKKNREEQAEPEGTKLFEPNQRASGSHRARRTTGRSLPAKMSQPKEQSAPMQPQDQSRQAFPSSTGYSQVQQDTSAYASYPNYSAQQGYAPYSEYSAQQGYTPYSEYSAQQGYTPYPEYSAQQGYAPYSQYSAYPDYSQYAAYGEPDYSQETVGIWKPLMLIGLIAGLILVLLAIVMVLMEAGLGFILVLGIAAVVVVIFGIICAVKYVGSN